MKIFATDDVSDSRDRIRRDGARVYNIEYSRKSRIIVGFRFENQLKYAMEPYKFSQSAKDDFDSFLIYYWYRYRTVLVLAPYHHKLYDIMRNKKAIYLDMNQQFRK